MGATPAHWCARRAACRRAEALPSLVGGVAKTPRWNRVASAPRKLLPNASCNSLWGRCVRAASISAAQPASNCKRLSSRSRRGPELAALIPLTIPEVRHLLVRLLWEHARPVEQVVAWSSWRRRHQARARRSHYRRRLRRNLLIYE